VETGEEQLMGEKSPCPGSREKEKNKNNKREGGEKRENGHQGTIKKKNHKNGMLIPRGKIGEGWWIRRKVISQRKS